MIALDADGDGLPDSWEAHFFGGLGQGPEDDYDHDGLTNAEELSLETDPTAWDGPGLPVVLAPSCGSRLATEQPSLVVGNALDPHDIASVYQFEVYDQASPATPVATSGDVPAGPGYTAWSIAASLQEDHTYVWRARAGDGVAFGGWSLSCSFVVDAVAGHRELTVTDDVVGSACDAYGNGGQRVLSGIDDGAGGGTADDGQLQPGEVRSTTIICNGGDGGPGQPGTDGNAALVVTDDLVGSACDAYGNGGQRIRTGLDDGDGGGIAGDGVLQAGEVESTTIVCNGRDGAPGAPGGSSGGCGTVPGTGSAWPLLLILAAFLRRRAAPSRPC
ncbi:MAG: MYXO-CTERM sorting domain-containing protein [Anaeromyxobacter sp.]